MKDIQKKRIITISGKPGSGKSSTAKKVADLLDFEYYSSGNMVREMLAERGMTLQEFNEKAKSEHSLDQDIDEQLRALREKQDIVVDSRLGFYWLPESFKVYLEIDMDTAAARIFGDIQKNKKRANVLGPMSNLGEVAWSVRKRMNEEQRRYRRLYGIDPYDSTRFDMVVNTSRHSPETVALVIFDEYKRWTKSKVWTQVYSEVPLGYSHKNEY
jgi:cytidylate kinase